MDDYGYDLYDRPLSIAALEALARWTVEGIEDLFSPGYLISIGAI